LRKFISVAVGVCMTLALFPMHANADPVFYYLYVNPVAPDVMQRYGPPGSPGSNIVCAPRGDRQICGVKADLVITVSPGANAHPPNETFADWRACQSYAHTLTLGNAGGFVFFCYGTDEKAFW
jgi:hypothetical protein